MFEPNELVDGYDPADPPQGDGEMVWCRNCSTWDEGYGCECDSILENEPVADLPLEKVEATAQWFDERERGSEQEPYSHSEAQARRREAHE